MKRAIVWAAAIVLFAATPLFPADGGKWFKWSLVAMWLSTAADVGTSLRANSVPGIHESNPLVGREFGARGVALQFGSRGIITSVELFLAHRRQRVTPYFAAGNFGLSAASSLAAAKNATLLVNAAPDKMQPPAAAQSGFETTTGVTQFSSKDLR